MSKPDWVYGPDGLLALRDRQQQAPWPEGVTARYLTVGGATVDISFADSSNGTCEADCLGCGDSDWLGIWDQPANDEDQCRVWAQEHAEKCRAMPRPGGA